ncbi:MULTISPECIES: hypothetical protein [unclassified Enterococcus]|uniref:hypothetical protein n=1 Tax=unclassified Enterococcus TaxID=2608891 RepID=UPI00155575D3|nr:hypothetical protein [Enterococcus sp. MMGLQ5-2]MBS7584138.1 hypothetical protein [Enterococcus sp. MMGLQ5-1]NPD11996.1 hypothetical protein [Enterococcus sp. MMGLQ5-1]NPD37501.1 hypothetical protein [Enterococcus sp. MMGLQ5-2]
MVKLTLSILDENNQVKLAKNDYETFLKPMQATGEDFVYLATQLLPIQNGDSITLTLEQPNQYLMVKLDETLEETLIFVKGTSWRYQPMLSTNGLEAICENAFRAKRHYLQVRLARAFEIKQYRNLSFNPHDQKEDSLAYPHAYANIETRNDATFFARNAIDGIFANNSHGSYPYQSWGINQQQDAALTIDFGRKVLIDKIGLTLRSDFPHDSYWTKASVVFDDKVEKEFTTIKSSVPQYFNFEAIEISKVTLTKLIKSDQDHSPFPALTQIECFGYNLDN